ncbi:hypothetical protein TSUD_188880 [Trifolium subterraneum]|uniref:Uncharacterized protein n=1 Tax=Trifolium subterraneum TaxID=3900 RepID=A0A2Z6NWR7_TRISU|nr:hypothetical protein TSUD_188880 [Trifolium subterraneum]
MVVVAKPGSALEPKKIALKNITNTPKGNKVIEPDSEVHVASDPPVLSSTGPELDFAPNGVAKEQQEVAEANSLSIIAEEQQDVDVVVHKLERMQ